MKVRVLVPLVLLASPVVEEAAAHHSFAMFDTTKQMLMEGVVQTWQFNNPHAWLHINVTTDDGSEELWSFESSDPVTLIRRGINGQTFEPGDVVRVVHCPLRNGRTGGAIAFVQLEDGTTLLPTSSGCNSNAALEHWTENGWLETSSNGEVHPAPE